MSFLSIRKATKVSPKRSRPVALISQYKKIIWKGIKKQKKKTRYNLDNVDFQRVGLVYSKSITTWSTYLKT